MIEINVKIKSENESSWTFGVEIMEDGSKSVHVVELDKTDYERLVGERISPEELIKKSFEFLLARESKESILREFNLMKISQYFPEYEKEINQ
ncbi:MAG: hypothetical protein KAT05_09760 [Spirochaetes bacterium]|nr:hypothetical protein [Spirochaetota bacterium]